MTSRTTSTPPVPVFLLEQLLAALLLFILIILSVKMLLFSVAFVYIKFIISLLHFIAHSKLIIAFKTFNSAKRQWRYGVSAGWTGTAVTTCPLTQ